MRWRASATDPLQLTKEEEAAGGDEVRREDQDKINRFSRLHQNESNLEEELKAKQVGPASWEVGTI